MLAIINKHNVIIKNSKELFLKKTVGIIITITPIVKNRIENVRSAKGLLSKICHE